MIVAKPLQKIQRISPSINKNRLEAHLCRASFYDFFLRFWPVVVAEPLVANWHIKFICDELQAVVGRAIGTAHSSEHYRIREKRLHNLIVNVCPGSTKSTICSVMLPAWAWTNDNTFRIICGSFAHPLALHLATQTARVVMSDKYKELFPDVEILSEAKNMLTLTTGGERIATSTEGGITGRHGHCIVIDDPLSPKEAVSDVSLKAANEWMDHTLNSRMVDKSVTPLILVMQRLHQNDPTGHLLSKSGQTEIRHICLPAEIDKVNEKLVRPRALRKNYVDGLFDPVRLPHDVLRLALADMGNYAYAGQYGQFPVPLGASMFLTDKVGIRNAAPKLMRLMRYWDKASSGGKGCWTVGTLIGVDSDRRFCVVDVVRGQWEVSERERIIRQTAERDGRGIIVAMEREPGSGGKESSEMTTRNLAGFRVRVDFPKGDKVIRAEPFSAQMNQGNVYLIAAPWNAVWLAEFQQFPYSKFKDQVDSASACFALIVGKKIMVGGFDALKASRPVESILR